MLLQRLDEPISKHIPVIIEEYKEKVSSLEERVNKLKKGARINNSRVLGLSMMPVNKSRFRITTNNKQMEIYIGESDMSTVGDRKKGGLRPALLKQIQENKR
ncbi:hypothetical protein JTB14_012697 [Gonioctena quinquepunctata]|nr:hypothetical protein JTB14_012697 [Gonioctena quinquepunctata]